MRDLDLRLPCDPVLAHQSPCGVLRSVSELRRVPWLGRSALWLVCAPQHVSTTGSSLLPPPPPPVIPSLLIFFPLTSFFSHSLFSFFLPWLLCKSYLLPCVPTSFCQIPVYIYGNVSMGMMLGQEMESPWMSPYWRAGGQPLGISAQNLTADRPCRAKQPAKGRGLFSAGSCGPLNHK